MSDEPPLKRFERRGQTYGHVTFGQRNKSQDDPIKTHVGVERERANPFTSLININLNQMSSFVFRPPPKPNATIGFLLFLVSVSLTLISLK